MNLLIRKATKADVFEVVALEHAIFNQSYTHEYAQTFLEQGNLLIAYDLDQIIGVVGWFDQGDNAEIIMIGVKSEYRRKHVGNMLMKACITMLLATNSKALFIEVRKNNKAAMKLYESLGFIENRVRENYYQNPVEDAIEMRLDL